MSERALHLAGRTMGRGRRFRRRISRGQIHRVKATNGVTFPNSILLGAVWGLVLNLAALFSLVLVGLVLPILFPGATQLLYLLPIVVAAGRQGRPRFIAGIMIAAALTIWFNVWLLSIRIPIYGP
ncbi:MAG: hypothetical protein CMJ83_12255 [Planctomycetes bacterium]|nr:hypothetical protein [Planctomycetota bacterium]